ncbi:MAG: hypothetical protein OXB88_06930 [Bacteriovoracales bacterium]|nr:hypothetical protein [Bacteriovoracales bacterium]
MKRHFFKGYLIPLSAMLLVISAAAFANDNPYYSILSRSDTILKDCHKFSISSDSNVTLTARCNTWEGSYRDKTINLNDHIDSQIDRKDLVWDSNGGLGGNAEFAGKKCKSFQYEAKQSGIILSANCEYLEETASGFVELKYITKTINLSDGIDNDLDSKTDLVRNGNN